MKTRLMLVIAAMSLSASALANDVAVPRDLGVRHANAHVVLDGEAREPAAAARVGALHAALPRLRRGRRRVDRVGSRLGVGHLRGDEIDLRLHHREVAVIGADVATGLYPSMNPIGKPVSVEFLCGDPGDERGVLFYKPYLERLGVTSVIRFWQVLEQFSGLPFR